MRLALVAILVAGCWSPEDHVLGAWDRVLANGEAIPSAPRDRLTFMQEGDALLERGGRVIRGAWELDGFDNITLSRYPDAPWTGAMSATPCPGSPGICRRLKGGAVFDVLRAAQ